MRLLMLLHFHLHLILLPSTPRQQKNNTQTYTRKFSDPIELLFRRAPKRLLDTIHLFLHSDFYIFLVSFGFEHIFLILEFIFLFFKIVAYHQCSSERIRHARIAIFIFQTCQNQQRCRIFLFFHTFGVIRNVQSEEVQYYSHHANKLILPRLIHRSTASKT